MTTRFKPGDWVTASNPAYGPQQYHGVLRETKNPFGEVKVTTRSTTLKSQPSVLLFPESRVYSMYPNLFEDAITPQLLLDLCFALKEQVENLEEAMASANDRLTKLTEEKNQ